MQLASTLGFCLDKSSGQFLGLRPEELDALHEVPSPQLDIRVELGPQRVDLIVVDNGPGIDEATLEHIFDPFYTTKEVGDGLGLGLFMARHVLRAAVAAARNLATLFARDKLDRLLRVNGDIMIRSVLLQASFTTFLFLGAAHGDVTLAANQVLVQFLSITAFALDGFAFAAESLVGQAVGARRPERVRRAAILTSHGGIGGALMLALIFWAGGATIIDLLTNAPAVRVEARQYLVWVGLAPLIGVAGWMFDGIFIGATLTREMRNAMVQAVAIYALAIVALPPLIGNHGLWAALIILNIARGVAMARLYPRAEAAALPAG